MALQSHLIDDTTDWSFPAGTGPLKWEEGSISTGDSWGSLQSCWNMGLGEGVMGAGTQGAAIK